MTDIVNGTKTSQATPYGDMAEQSQYRPPPSRKTHLLACNHLDFNQRPFQHQL